MGPWRTAPTLEGHLNARVLAGGHAACGCEQHAHTWINTLDSITRLTSFNMSGMTVSFAAGNRNGGNFVDVCTVARGARIIS